MERRECTRFLQWCLPRLHLRWEGYRKVRKQVCKRVEERISHLALAGTAAYRLFLEQNAREWTELDACCQITISRFYRDGEVFRFLEHEVLPCLAERALTGNEREVRCWSIGSASGEEPYTIAILWSAALQPRFPSLGLRIIATETKKNMIERAKEGCYLESSLKELPSEWKRGAFIRTGNRYCIREEEREKVIFLQQDVREREPEGLFGLIFCRNLAFTYFEAELQRKVLERLITKLLPGGALVVGAHESLTAEAGGLSRWPGSRKVYRKGQ